MADDGFPELETPRLRLRELQHADAEALFAIHGDQQAMRLWGVTFHISDFDRALPRR